MYTKPEAPDYIDVKGISLVRRDNCPLVKEVSTDVLEAIMHRKDVGSALEAARRHVRALLGGAHPISKFVVSKQTREDYKNDKQPHLYVARKMGQRRGHPVPSGTRVPYVFVRDDDDPDRDQADRAEDPEYAEAHGLPLDLLYYLDHQVWSPVCQLLSLLVDDPEAEVLRHETVAPLLQKFRVEDAAALKRAKRVRKNAANNQREITQFFARR